MQKFLKSAIALAAIGGAMQAQAELVIDKFNVGVGAGNQFVQSTGAIQYSTSAVTTSANILGGQRDVIVQRTTAPVGDTDSRVSAVVNVTDNLFRFSQDTSTAGYSILRYDGTSTVASDPINTSGLGSICVSCSAVGFVFKFGSDSGFGIFPVVDPFQITIDVWGAGGSASNSFTEIIPGTGGAATLVPGFVLLSEAAWTNPGFNWGDVSAMQITFNSGSPRAVDVDFAFTAPMGIPEPASILLAGLALAGIGAATRRRKSV